MYCKCGCGEITKIANRNLKDRGIKKGEHLLYLHGHNRRRSNYKRETEWICELYLKKHSVSEVSRITGITTGIVKYRLRQKGISRDRIEAVKHAHKNGLMPTPEGFKGPHTEETKKKLSKMFTGRKLSFKRKNPGSTGPKHHRWKGGISYINNRLRQSDEYNKWRKCVYKRDWWTCQHCGDKPRKIVAHHIRSFKDFPDLRYDVDNGITLCRKCHKLAHPEIGMKTRFKKQNDKQIISWDGSRLHHDLKNPRTELTVEYQ